MSPEFDGAQQAPTEIGCDEPLEKLFGTMPVVCFQRELMGKVPQLGQDRGQIGRSARAISFCDYFCDLAAQFLDMAATALK